MFATHYHELTGLGARLDGLANASMLVREHDGQLVFLHEVGAGAADRSYGIHVAELAGLPPTVIARARAVLALLEENRAAADLVPALDELPLFTPQPIAPPKRINCAKPSPRSTRPPDTARGAGLALPVAGAYVAR